MLIFDNEKKTVKNITIKNFIFFFLAFSIQENIFILFYFEFLLNENAP